MSNESSGSEDEALNSCCIAPPESPQDPSSSASSGDSSSQSHQSSPTKTKLNETAESSNQGYGFVREPSSQTTIGSDGEGNFENVTSSLSSHQCSHHSDSEVSDTSPNVEERVTSPEPDKDVSSKGSTSAIDGSIPLVIPIQENNSASNGIDRNLSSQNTVESNRKETSDNETFNFSLHQCSHHSDSETYDMSPNLGERFIGTETEKDVSFDGSNSATDEDISLKFPIEGNDPADVLHRLNLSDDSRETVSAGMIDGSTLTEDITCQFPETMNRTDWSNSVSLHVEDSLSTEDDTEDPVVEEASGSDCSTSSHGPSEARLKALIRSNTEKGLIESSIAVDRNEMLLSILTFARSYSLPNTATAKLCEMQNIFCQEKVIPDTRYMMDKYFYNNEGMTYYAVCPSCKGFIREFDPQERSVLCSDCNLTINLKSSTYHDYFVMLDFPKMMKKLIEENGDYYLHIMNRERGYTIKDIYDGRWYRKFWLSLPDELKKRYATVIFNSDGSPLFKSSKFSVWPIQIIINELPIGLRTKKPIVSALWFGHDKPCMTIFLTPFVTKMNQLSEQGVRCRINGVSRLIHVYAVCSCVDSMARAPMQGSRVCTGRGGCNWCLHMGEAVPSPKNPKKKTIYYTLLQTVPPKRTHLDTVAHMEQALVTGTAVFGMKNVSPLILLKFFDIINGFVPDSLHCGSLGVCRQFARHWFDERGKPYSLSRSEQEQIDRYLDALKVPEQAARLSRSFKARKMWHGREWDNWALAYSLPILMTFPRFRKYAEHWGLYCEAFHILMSDEISHQNLMRAHDMLNNFVALTEVLYGKRAMTFNVHQLSHLAQSVADWGPLWSHNGYAFESGNGEILKHIHSAKGVINQICRNLNMNFSLRIIETSIQRENSPAVSYCRSLKTTETAKSVAVGGCRCFGKAPPAPEWVLQAIHVAAEECEVYHRMCKQGCLYRSAKKNCLRSDNSHAQLRDGNFIQISFFVADRSNNKLYIAAKNITGQRVGSFTFLNKITDINDNLLLVDSEQLQRICFHLSLNDNSYIVPIPTMTMYS